MRTLIEDLRAERLAAYARVRGGYPVPLAGMIYWLGLGVAGHYLALQTWLLLAFATSGVIFPLAVCLSWILRSPFLKDKTALGGLLIPTFIGMLLFWPMAVAAYWTAPGLTPLILAIGLSMHWPVIGWTYARTPLFAAHAIMRAIACFYIWRVMPAAATTLMPFTVAAIYGVTVMVILMDASLVRRRLATD